MWPELVPRTISYKDFERICRFQIFILTSLAFSEGLFVLISGKTTAAYIYWENAIFLKHFFFWNTRKRHLNPELSKISKKKFQLVTYVTVQLV